MAESGDFDKSPKWVALTNVASFEFKFDWTINGFLKIEKLPGEALLSPNFGGPTNNAGLECVIKAKVYPRGVNEKYKDYLSVFFIPQLYPANPAYETMARYEVSILAVEGRKLETKSLDLYVFRGGRGFRNFIPLKELENRQDEYLPSGNLTLHFEGKVWITFESSKQKDLPVKTIPDSNVPTMIAKHFLETGNNSDVTIKAGSRKLKCHKCVLSIRSEYFRAMFESGMQENQEGMIDFSDQMDGDVLKDLLEYLYLGMASNLERTCQKMLEIANMFQLDDLKSQSEEELIVKLSPDNAWDLAVLARQHGAKMLHKKAISLLDKCL